MVERAAKGTYSEDEVAAAIASVLDPGWESEGNTRENVIRELLLFLPDPPEPEAAMEAARMIVVVDKANGGVNNGTNGRDEANTSRG